MALLNLDVIRTSPERSTYILIIVKYYPREWVCKDETGGGLHQVSQKFPLSCFHTFLQYKKEERSRLQRVIIVLLYINKILAFTDSVYVLLYLTW